MSAVMGTFGNMTLHAGPDAWVRCGTYTNGPLPNLSVAGGGWSCNLRPPLGSLPWHPRKR